MNNPTILLSLSMLCSFIVLAGGCGGTYDYKVLKLPQKPMDEKYPETVSLSVSSEDMYHYSLGFSDYNLHVREGIRKYYEHMLAQNFIELIKDKTADVNLQVTTIDVSVLPIKGIIIDIRLSLKVEIHNKKMEKEKTVIIDGFGSDPEGNRAMEKAVKQSFDKLDVILEEMYITH